MIQIENITFQYAETEEKVLDNFGIEIQDGQCVLLCGESGCGKTSAIRLINGLIPHFYEGTLQGNCKVNGLDVFSSPLEQISRFVGTVFQNPRSQFFCVDTTGEIAFAPENMGLEKSEILDRVNKTVQQFHIESLMNRNIFRLSGGEKQKIACASVSALEPDVIVLDEPTSNLDQDGIKMLGNIVQLWKQQGKTIIIAEHRLGWLKHLADRVVCLKKGIIQLDLSGEQFFAQSDRELNLLGLRGTNLKSDYFCYESPGLKCIDKTFLEKQISNREYLFSDFVFGYDRKKIIWNMNGLKIPEHSVVAIVGRNGVGKTTFSKCLCGIQKDFHGSVSIGNSKYKGKQLRNLCYMVMQDVNHQLFTDSVEEEISLGLAEVDEKTVDDVLQKLDLTELKKRHPMSLSGGQKQRTAIGSAYLSDRNILIFDEPTSGLDFQRMEKTAKLIQKISQEKTVLIVTHDAELIQKCCTHLLVFV